MPRADSVVLNPHKWLGAQFDCSIQFLRDPGAQVRTLGLRPTYLETAGREGQRSPVDGLADRDDVRVGGGGIQVGFPSGMLGRRTGGGLFMGGGIGGAGVRREFS